MRFIALAVSDHILDILVLHHFGEPVNDVL